MQGLTVFPLTSISQAPQLPVKHPLGISNPTFSAITNQSSPSVTNEISLFGHRIFMFDFFNVIMMRYSNVSRIHLQDYQLLLLF